MTAKSPQKQPTNAELMAVLEPLVQKVDVLMQWKHDEELAKKVVAEYVASQPKQLLSSKGSEQWLSKELLKTLGITLSIIAALVALAAQILRGGR